MKNFKTANSPPQETLTTIAFAFFFCSVFQFRLFLYKENTIKQQ